MSELYISYSITLCIQNAPLQHYMTIVTIRMYCAVHRTTAPHHHSYEIVTFMYVYAVHHTHHRSYEIVTYMYVS